MLPDDVTTNYCTRNFLHVDVFKVFGCNHHKQGTNVDQNRHVWIKIEWVKQFFLRQKRADFEMVRRR